MHEHRVLILTSITAVASTAALVIVLLIALTPSTFGIATESRQQTLGSQIDDVSDDVEEIDCKITLISDELGVERLSLGDRVAFNQRCGSPSPFGR